MTTETREKISIPIKGMTCASCVSHVQNALEEVSGVEEINVNLATEKAIITLGPDAAELDDLVFAIRVQQQ